MSDQPVTEVFAAQSSNGCIVYPGHTGDNTFYRSERAARKYAHPGSIWVGDKYVGPAKITKILKGTITWEEIDVN